MVKKLKWKGEGIQQQFITWIIYKLLGKWKWLGDVIQPDMKQSYCYHHKRDYFLITACGPSTIQVPVNELLL